MALTCRNVLAEILPGRVSGAARRRCAGQASGRRFVLTLHDRHPSFGEARNPAVDMGGDLVAEVAILLRTEPGELPADPTAGRRPHLADERMGSAQQSGQRRMQTWSSPLRSYRPLLVATHASTTTRTCAGIRATTTAGGIPASST